MQSLDIFNTVVLMRLRRLAAVHLTDSIVTGLLEVRPVGQVADDPRKGVAEVNASSNCR